MDEAERPRPTEVATETVRIEIDHFLLAADNACVEINFDVETEAAFGGAEF